MNALPVLRQFEYPLRQGVLRPCRDVRPDARAVRERSLEMAKSTIWKMFILGLLTLSLAACETPKNYNRAAGWEQQRFDCNGDVASNYPPYCHPSR